MSEIGWLADIAQHRQFRHRAGVELEEARSALRRAQRILASPVSHQAEEWMMLATLVGEADLVIQQSSLASADLKVLLQEVVGLLREVTNNFTDPAFLGGSGAARRRNQALFCAKA